MDPVEAARQPLVLRRILLVGKALGDLLGLFPDRVEVLQRRARLLAQRDPLGDLRALLQITDQDVVRLFDLAALALLSAG